jgi:hypothetical protein
MSSVIIAGNTSGTITLDAPAVAGTTTLTLPTTSGTVALTSQITSGGMTLLGTLTTTSGTAQTLSGLTLTSYKQIYFTLDNVGKASGNSILLLNGCYLAGINILEANAAFGNIFNDLSNAIVSVNLSHAPKNSSGIYDVGSAVSYYQGGGRTNITTASTSISFTWAGGNTFSTGTIKVYGVA